MSAAVLLKQDHRFNAFVEVRRLINFDVSACADSQELAVWRVFHIIHLLSESNRVISFQKRVFYLKLKWLMMTLATKLIEIEYPSILVSGSGGIGGN